MQSGWRLHSAGGGGRMQMCGVAVEGGTMGEAQQAIVGGGQELTHERGMRVSHQALRTGQWGVKVSVPAETMSGRGTTSEHGSMERQRAGGRIRRLNR